MYTVNRSWLALVVVVAVSLVTAGCLWLAYDNPSAPSPAASTPAPVPAHITASVLYGLGNGAGRAFLTAHVEDASGRAVAGVPVTLNVINGTIERGPDLNLVPTDSSLTITSDIAGQLQATVVGRGSVTVTLTAGLASTTLTLVIP